MDAPERIKAWVWNLDYPSKKNGSAEWNATMFPADQDHHEYIRADLAAPDLAELVEAAKAQTAAMIAYWEADEAASYAEEHACTEDQVWLTDEQIKAMRKSATDAWQAIPALTEATAAVLAKLGGKANG